MGFSGSRLDIAAKEGVLAGLFSRERFLPAAETEEDWEVLQLESQEPISPASIVPKFQLRLSTCAIALDSTIILSFGMV